DAPLALFSHGLGMPLVAGNHEGLLALYFAGEGGLQLTSHNLLSEVGGHSCGVVAVQALFLGGRLAREVRSREVQAQDPDAERLMAPGEGGARQVIESAAAGGALVALAMRLGLVAALLDDPVRVAARTANAVGPAEGTDRVVALGFVDQGPDV